MINKTIPLEEIQLRIRSIEKDVRTLKRLYFIKYRYQGLSVAEVSKNVGVTKMVGYYWQESWNGEGFSGLKPRFAGGSPSRLSEEQNIELRSILEKRDHRRNEEDAEEDVHASFKTLPARLSQTQECRRYSKKT